VPAQKRQKTIKDDDLHPKDEGEDEDVHKDDHESDSKMSAVVVDEDDKSENTGKLLIIYI